MAFEDIADEFAFDAIIIAGRWESQDMDVLQETANYLAAKTKNVIVFGPIIEYKQALPRLLARYGEDEQALKEASTYKRIEELDQRMQDLLERSESEYYSILSTMCPSNGCQHFTMDGSPIQFDSSHLTHTGAMEVVNNLLHQGMLKTLVERSDVDIQDLMEGGA